MRKILAPLLLGLTLLGILPAALQPVPVIGEAFEFAVEQAEAGSYTFRSVGTIAQNGNGAALAPGAPAGKAVGDLLLMLTATRDTNDSIGGTLTGWTLIHSQADAAAVIKLYCRVADGGANDSAAPDWTANNDSFAWIEAYHGDVHSDCSTIVAHSANQAAGSTASNLTLPALTITTDDTLVYAASVKRKTATSDDATTITAPAALTKRAQLIQAGTAVFAASASAQQTTATNFDGSDFTRDGTNENVTGQGFVVALLSDEGAAPPAFDTVMSCAATDEDSLDCTYDGGTVADTIFICAKSKGSAAPADGAAVEAGTGCSGTATEVVTGASDTITVNITDGDPLPRQDIYGVLLEGASNYSTIDTELDEQLVTPAGRQYITKSGAPGVGEDGIVDGASPAAVDGDTVDAPLLSDSFLQGDGAHCVTVNANTTFLINTIKDNDCTTDVPLDNSRQLLCRRFADYSIPAWSDPACVDLAVNNGVPVYFGLDDLLGTINPYLFAVGVALSHHVNTLFVDPEIDAMTLTVDAIAGLTVSGGNTWSGTPTACGVTAAVTFTATDEYGDSDDGDETVTIGTTVPDVGGMSEAAAIAAIEAQDAGAGCVLTATAGAPRFNSTVALGNVIETSPEADALVVPDQEVTYFLSLGPRPPTGDDLLRMRHPAGMRIIH